MKIKILFLSLFITFLLLSCEQSKKGAWTRSDEEKCKSDIIKGMKKAEEYEELKTMYKIDEDNLSTCICDKFEDKYESFYMLDLKINMESKEKDFQEIFLSCLGESDEQSKIGAWTKSDKEKCKSELIIGMKNTKEYEELKKIYKIEYEDLSKCFCDKIEVNYESFYIYDLKIDIESKEKEAIKIFFSCIGKDLQ